MAKNVFSEALTSLHNIVPKNKQITTFYGSYIILNIMPTFNVTGHCIPGSNYMADTNEKISRIVQFVEQGDYFTINRGRQYGKTTTLLLLEKQLQKRYTVIKISFEGVGNTMFESEESFCQGLLSICSKYFSERKLPGSEDWVDSSVKTFGLLGGFISKACSDKDVVLMIDEIDKTSNNTIFLLFLGLLRDKFLKRKEGAGATFKSVVLAGVYDVKNLKHKMIQAGTHQLQDSEKRLNSPWNIAIDFDVDMTLSVSEITSMLMDYEKDNKTGMDIGAIAKEIREYTNGYPYLVSRICWYIDTKFNKSWTMQGIQSAVRRILVDKTTLFDDLNKNIEGNPDLKELLRELTIGNRAYPYNVDNHAIQLAEIFGIVEEREPYVAIHNRIFEVRITNYLMLEKEIAASRAVSGSTINLVVNNGKFDVPVFLEKFANHYYEIYRHKDIKFMERECRLLFITYLSPYINGTGFYHLESEIRENERTDIIVDYKTEQFIIELKLWHGEAAHENAYEQLARYLDSKNKDVGYLVTFDFRKTKNVGNPQFNWVEYGGKKIFDVVVGFDNQSSRSKKMLSRKAGNGCGGESQKT